MWIEWWLLFFIIIATEGLQAVQKSSGHSAAEKTLKTLLESCCKNDNPSNPIIILGDYNDFIDESSIIRINSTFRFAESSKNNQLFNFKASEIVLIEQDSEELESHLKLLKSTKWWNHMARFFIIIKNHEGCRNFEDILTATWKINIINSILICSSGNTSVLYTSNPLANYAPYPWERIEDLDNLNVFRQVFYANTSCDNLNYDKTRYLDGYKINAIARPHVCVNSVCGNGHFNSAENRFAPAFLYFYVKIRALNASCKLQCHPSTDHMLEHLENNHFDLSLRGFILHEQPDKVMLNFHFSTRIIAIVQLNPEIPTLYKIIHMWSPPVLVGASIVLATFFTILAILYRNFSSALLDLIRLLTYVSIRLDNRWHSFRIYFTTILILMIISNGVFQGKIAADLTKPERFPAIETIDQLIEFGYKFYTYERSEGGLESLCLRCNMTSVPLNDCIELVRNTTLNACIVPELSYYQYNLSEFEVEPIKNPVANVYWKQLCRDDWPLYDRFNRVWSAIIDSGLSNFWVKRLAHGSVEIRQARDRELNSAHYRPVKLVKLDFAFKLLAVGLSLSLGCFFIEALIAKYRNQPLKKCSVANALGCKPSKCLQLRALLLWVAMKYRRLRNKKAHEEANGIPSQLENNEKTSGENWSQLKNLSLKRNFPYQEPL